MFWGGRWKLSTSDRIRSVPDIQSIAGRPKIAWCLEDLGPPWRNSGFADLHRFLTRWSYTRCPKVLDAWMESSPAEVNLLEPLCGADVGAGICINT